MTPFKKLSIYWITGRIDFKVPTVLPITISSFLLEFKVSRTQIESLKWQIRRGINQVTFGKFVTLLVQKLKIKSLQYCESRWWLQIFFFLDQRRYKFSQQYLYWFVILDFQFLSWRGNVVCTLNWIQPVWILRWVNCIGYGAGKFKTETSLCQLLPTFLHGYLDLCRITKAPGYWLDW